MDIIFTVQNIEVAPRYFLFLWLMKYCKNSLV